MCQGGCLLEKKNPIAFKYTVYSYTYSTYQSVGTFLTLVDLVWDSCLAHLSLSLQASLASLSPPLFQVSFLLSPVKYFNTVIITRNHRFFFFFFKKEVCWGEQLTPSTCFPSCSFTHGHQPRTAFWEKSELGIGLFKEDEFGIPGSIFRLHFSGLLAGGIKLRRSSSTEPLGEIKFKSIRNVNWNFFPLL